MPCLRDRETPARRSARLEAMRQRTNIYVYTYLQIHFNIATYTFQLHALSREAFCTMCIPSKITETHNSFNAAKDTSRD